MPVGVRSLIERPVEFSGVRGLPGEPTDEPRDWDSLLTRLKKEYIDEFWTGKFASTFYFLMPVIALGALGSRGFGALFNQRLARFIPHLWQRDAQVVSMALGDEFLSAFFTSGFRIWQTGEGADAYFKDLGQGVIVRAGLSCLVPSSPLGRFLLLPLLMTSLGWGAEVIVEGRETFEKEFGDGFGCEFLYRFANTTFMTLFQTRLLKGLSLHAEEWRFFRGSTECLLGGWEGSKEVEGETSGQPVQPLICWNEVESPPATVAQKRLVIGHLTDGEVEGWVREVRKYRSAAVETDATGIDQDSLPSTLKFWREITLKGDQFASLDLKLPSSIQFRHQELSPKGRKGTIIDLGEASVEDILRTLTAWRDLIQPKWRKTKGYLPRDEEETRVLVRPDLARRVMTWGHEYERRIRRVHREEIARLNMYGFLGGKRERNEPLTEEDRRFLSEIGRTAGEAYARFTEWTQTWGWVARIAIPAGGQEGQRTLYHVAHDFIRHGGLMFGLLNMVGQIERPQGMIPGWRADFAFSEGGSLKEILEEATGLAAWHMEEQGVSLHFPSTKLLYHLLDDDPDIRAGLIDITANLLINATEATARVDGEKMVRIDTEVLEDGSVQVTVSNRGTIPAEKLEGLGSEEVARVDDDAPAGLRGLGLGSVIATLRGNDWGPLWIKSDPEEGWTHIRFTISGTDVKRAGQEEDPVFKGWRETSPFERNLEERFVVPAASMPAAVKELFRQVPPDKDYEEVPELRKRDSLVTQLILEGRLRRRRLAALSKLLAGPRGPEEVTVVENGPLTSAETAVVLARGGFGKILIKEPGANLIWTHRQYLMTTPPEIRGRVHHVDPSALDNPTPARIVAWVSFNPLREEGQDKRRDLTEGFKFESYMGRDVEPGGYLVVQTDETSFYPLPQMPAAEWDRVYCGEIPGKTPIRKYGAFVFPTAHVGKNLLSFCVYRRKT